MAGLAAIPAAKTLSACADFNLTVLPYLSRATPILTELLDAARSRSLDDVGAWYLRTNPLATGFVFSVALGFAAWVASELTRNHSQVDRLWSVLPCAYVLHFDLWARRNGVPSARLDVALLCVVAWSARLTFNYWRRGGYSWGSEDYRWAAIKAQIGSTGMFIMNATFISFVQSVCCPLEVGSLLMV
jgi:steroid 5-alpha reductase family enzyme